MVAPNSLFCQVCFDEIPVRADAVTQLCGAACPAVLCTSCLVGHVSSALQVGYVGALPRVRCPICLVPMHKSQWSKFVRASTRTPDGKRFVLEEYVRLCQQACSFQTPCCHNPAYVHLPKRYRPNKDKHLVCKIRRSQIPLLRKKCRQFGRHRISPRDLITYIADTFPDRRREVVEAVLARIDDEERRATLLLSYHYAVDRTVKTTCCDWTTCFNCKRSVSADSSAYRCEDEDEEIDEDSELVQCRSCRATLIKVDGCDAVQCMCGFDMDWANELTYRRKQQQQLLPVDPFDTTVFADWVTWHDCLTDVFHDVCTTVRVKMQLTRLCKTHAGFVPALRQFIWWRRFQRMQRSDETQRAVRTAYIDRVLVPRLQPVLRQYISQRRVTKLLAELETTVRRRVVDAEIARQRDVLQRFVSVAVSQWRRRAAVVQLKHMFFWTTYAASHASEQQALEREERAFLTQFNVCAAA